MPSRFKVSSRTLKSVIPLALKNLAALLVPERKNKNDYDGPIHSSGQCIGAKV